MRLLIVLIVNYLLPQRLLTRLFAWGAHCRVRWIAQSAIRRFARRYRVDLSECESQKLEDYETFNAFFTRHLRSGTRPIAGGAGTLVSPVDGILSHWGRVHGRRLVQAKGQTYRLDGLLAAREPWATNFAGGSFITLYLSPRHYHRVHMPIAGKLRETIYVPGKLFSVSPATAATIPDIFARNERLICVFDTALGPMAVILVGAMIVAGINTVWAGRIPPGKRIVCQSYENIELSVGAELGHFSLGSTVILLVADSALRWRDALRRGQEINVGESLSY